MSYMAHMHVARQRRPTAVLETLMTAREWWTAAVARARGEGPARWRDLLVFADLPVADQRRIRRRIAAGYRDMDPDIRAVAHRIAGDVELCGWQTESITRHLELEIAAAKWRGRQLDPDEPVPGCDCKACTECLPSCPLCYGTSPSRKRPGRKAHHDPRKRAPLDVDGARAVPLLDVAARLGIEPNRHGWALCPFHNDSSPSLHLNVKKNAAFCNACSRSWDAIAPNCLIDTGRSRPQRR